ncbi:MAG: hypothetical protein KAR21_04615 [Spirochaetales bacterium]|nr:hypothetical protein [Spirochaetales bacterium]
MIKVKFQLFFLISILFITSCKNNVLPGPSVTSWTDIEAQNPAYSSYRIIGLWDFQDNLSSSYGRQESWDVENADLSNGQLHFDGIYEVSGLPDAELGIVSISTLDPESMTIAVAFNSGDNGTVSGTQRPILVAGLTHRWLGLIMENGKLVIYLNNHEYEYPTELLISENRDHVLVVSVELELNIINYSLDGIQKGTINLPSDFSWNFGVNYIDGRFNYGKLCVQNYFNGTAFKGSIDWVLAASGQLTAAEVKYIIENNGEEPSLEKEQLLLESAYSSQSFSGQADTFTLAEGLRNTVNIGETSSRSFSGLGIYRNYTPTGNSIQTISISGPLFRGNVEGHIYLNDSQADNWELSSYIVYAEAPGPASIKLEIYDGNSNPMVKLGEALHTFESPFSGYITLNTGMSRIPADHSIYTKWTQSGGTGLRVSVSGGNNSATPIGRGEWVLSPYDLSTDGESWEHFAWTIIDEKELVIDLDIPVIPETVNLYLEGDTSGVSYILTDGTNSSAVLTPMIDELVNLTWQPTKMIITQPDGLETEFSSYVLMWE